MKRMMMLQLGLDIEIEILKRLPPKSLVRFTSVSKQWKSIIQSSRFITDYSNIIQQQQTSSNLFFVGFSNSRNFAIIKEKQPNKLCNDDDDDIGSRQSLTLLESDDDFRDFDSRCELIGYSQGLFGFFNRKDRLVIWNPSIRKSLFIPLPPDLGRPYYYYFCFTVVCNATEPTIFYTTVRTVFTTIEPRLRVQTYTLSSGAWRTVSYTTRESLWFTGQQEVTDRFIYWIAFDWNDDDLLNYVIMSFDIAREQFTELCLPPALASSQSQNTSLQLSKLRESLGVLEVDTNKKEIGVWMMEPGGVEKYSFTKQFTINLPADTPNLQRDREVNVLAFTMMEPGGVQNLLTNQLADLINKLSWEVKVLGFTIDGQVILQMKFYPGNWQLLFYEPDSNSFKYIGKPRKKHYDLAGSYMETLLLLDH